MTTQEYLRIVRHWEYWKLYHLAEDKFQLCHYNDRGYEDYRVFITAADDDTALEQCSDIVKNFDRIENE